MKTHHNYIFIQNLRKKKVAEFSEQISRLVSLAVGAY